MLKEVYGTLSFHEDLATVVEKHVLVYNCKKAYFHVVELELSSF